MFLEELRQDISSIKGVGKVNTAYLRAMGINQEKDLLLHVPRAYEDRKNRHPLKEAFQGKAVNTIVRVIAHDYIGYGSKRSLKVWIEDESSRAALLCFGRNFLVKSLPVGKKIFIHGNFQYSYGELQASRFDFETYSENPRHFGQILPVYPLSGKLQQNFLRQIIKSLLDKYLSLLDDELPLSLREKYLLPEKKQALRALHFPSDKEELLASRRALAFEELFLFQLGMMKNKATRKSQKKKRSFKNNELEEKLKASLSFTLTLDQQKVLAEIKKDLFSESVMMRLLQGDVGCGKTLVAFISLLSVIQNKEQAVFLAPTELLAHQHAQNAARLLHPLGVRLALLSGKTKGQARRLLLDKLEKGEIDLLIGTHAVFSADTEFKNLGLIIIDEQHKFGVLQRAAIRNKGKMPDLLSMTATPIPRSLSLTLFGDLDISTIRQLPPGRKKPHTRAWPQKKEKQLFEKIKQELEKGRQAYFVYPLIEKSEKLDLKNAEDMFKVLDNEIYPGFNCGLIHSRLKEEEKERQMDLFVKGRLDILVSTSVVEVGVDVANATVMVINQAERFGLASLHQLRGRVGRGSQPSYVYLLYDENCGDLASQRIKIMEKYSDGFKIAEEDLIIRGPGDLGGIKQAGFVNFIFADLRRDIKLMEKCREEALVLLEEDPGFIKLKNSALRRLFENAPPVNPVIQEAP